MELQIRLAYERGLLTQKKITRIQGWALAWYLTAKDMREDEDRNEHLKGMLSIMNPRLYNEIYNTPTADDVGLEGDPYGEDEFTDIDSFLSRIDGQRKVEERVLYTEWM